MVPEWQAILNFNAARDDGGGKKVKVAHLLQRHLQSWTVALLQPWKWQLIVTGCSIAAQASGCPLPALTDFGPAVMQPVCCRSTTPQSTTPSCLHPSGGAKRNFKICKALVQSPPPTYQHSVF